MGWGMFTLTLSLPNFELDVLKKKDEFKKSKDPVPRDALPYTVFQSTGAGKSIL